MSLLNITFEHYFWMLLFNKIFGHHFSTYSLDFTFGRHFWTSLLDFRTSDLEVTFGSPLWLSLFISVLDVTFDVTFICNFLNSLMDVTFGHNFCMSHFDLALKHPFGRHFLMSYLDVTFRGNIEPLKDRFSKKYCRIQINWTWRVLVTFIKWPHIKAYWGSFGLWVSNQADFFLSLKGVVYIQIIRWIKSLCVITEAQDNLRNFCVL